MPRRASSKRAHGRKLSRVEQPVSTKRQEIPMVSLGSLPTEILVEIASYLRGETLPYRWRASQPFPRNHVAFQSANFLRAISQTCRALRSFALPLLWQRIEVCSSDYETKSLWEKDLATELVRQLEITTVRDPSLAQYVSEVNIFITRFSIKPVIDELARCLPLFPNLNKVQILGESGPALHYDHAFKTVALNGVKTLFIPDAAMAIVKCCPNVRRLIKMGLDDPITMYDFADVCPMIEEIYGFDIGHRHDLTTFVQQYPHTRVVNIYEIDAYSMYADPRFKDNLGQLQSLECIRVELSPEFDRGVLSVDIPPEHDAPELSRQVLTTSSELYPPPEGAHKCLIVANHRTGKMEHSVISGECQSEDGCVHFGWMKSPC